jgi:hypothetical protein
MWYIAVAAAELRLLREGPTGAKTTYTFKLNKDDMVTVSWNANVAFIPAHCAKSETGDKTRCAPK